MTSDPDNLLTDLEALAGRIDRQVHPGAAWTAPPTRPILRRVVRPAAAAAAAALVIAGIVLIRPAKPPADPVAGDIPGPGAVVRAIGSLMDWTVPADIHIAGLSQVRPAGGLSEISMQAPRLPAPPSVQIPMPGGLTWRAPTLSFTTNRN